MRSQQEIGPPSRPLIRVRTGCFTCRGRKKKCDEKRPRCSGCLRNDLECRWPHTSDAEVAKPAKRRRADTLAEERPAAANGDDAWEAISGDNEQAFPDVIDYLEDQDLEIDPLLYENIGESPLAVHGAEVAGDGESDAGDISVHDLSLSTSILPLNSSHPSPKGLSLLPDHEHESFELLSHYLSRTAISMGNGATDVNPFVAQLIPLAFSNNLILQLILAQSASHRSTSTDLDNKDKAVARYGRSLQLFRKNVKEYLSGKDEARLILGVGALIMCFTETAKGDTNGAIFDHLSAASALLVDSNSRPILSAPDALEAFIVEYFVYTKTLSLISTDARFSIRTSLDPVLESKAKYLISMNYVGQLCGCWLNLLLLIPRIYELGRTALSHASRPENELLFPSADDVALFASLYAEIMLFIPPADIRAEVAIAGYIFQQAILLYLLTTMDGLGSTVGGNYQSIIHGAQSTAIEYLKQVPATARINTSLCWPLAVIASCTEANEVQEFLRDRLKTMCSQIGLGNIKETLNIVEHLWQLPLSERSPWTICRTMQEHQLWISFA